ncbi:acid protease [Lindgomyces ingoldianus]|uniref:Acid protease n=1 Tax=Lindgomyces ingoldianus TaxID=673940 RepID=A0ACB6QRR6_9PLEO|nr:acid protease [Lindgomyces ingoldianus]KAF2468987.1 acid protease [Lindgomyces ingoldianus]
MKAFGHKGLGLLGYLICLRTLEILMRDRAFREEAKPLQRNTVEDDFEVNQVVLVERASQNTTIPAPIVASVSQYWEGNDGTWSSFTIQVGQKPQNVRILPSTASTSTWVIYDQGCPSDAPNNCRDSRGGTFNPNNSLTWVPNSIFELGVESNLEFNVFGDFGFDSVTLGWPGSGGPSVEHSIVAGVGDTTFSWLGVLGLNPRPTNFSTFLNNPQVGFVQALKNQNNIPSVSWSYTAGAPYRLNKVFGSLVIGGYDESRFDIPSTTSSNLTFPFYTDISRDILVGIASITTSNSTSSSSSTPLLKNGIFAFIDSTVPHLWLPESVCSSFESAFGLTWNASSKQYTLNTTQHNTLTKLNPSITITLAPQLPATSVENSVSITLPYSAFDLNISWPHASTTTYYFPLKRAANETQYTLGRAFLQEAYLIADYERSNFSVWPCSWGSNTNNAKIVGIRSVNDTSINSSNPLTGNGGGGSSGKGVLSTGAIMGMAVGIAVLVLGICLGLILYIRRRHQSGRRSFELEGTSTSLDPLPAGATYQQKDGPLEELDSRARHELPGHHKFGLLEAPDAERKFEMDGSSLPTEAGGRETSHDGQNPAIYEMDAAEHISRPAIFIQPPTAVSPGPGAGLPSPLPTSGEIGVAQETGMERRLGHGADRVGRRDKAR